jgi:hypothetical protein
VKVFSLPRFLQRGVILTGVRECTQAPLLDSAPIASGLACPNEQALAGLGRVAVGAEINHTYIIAQENWVKGRCIGNWSFTIGAVRGRLAAFCRDLH